MSSKNSTKPQLVLRKVYALLCNNLKAVAMAPSSCRTRWKAGKANDTRRKEKPPDSEISRRTREKTTSQARSSLVVCLRTLRFECEDDRKASLPPIARKQDMKAASWLAAALLSSVLGTASCSLMTKSLAQWAIDQLKANEEVRSKISFRGTDRRASTPFITGDGFRAIANHICEDANRCRMDPAAVKKNDIIFVKTDFFDFFAQSVIPRISAPYIVVSHNGDLSAPDGQDDAPRIGMPRYVASPILEEEYTKGRLLAHHGQNLWWKNSSAGKPRPAFSHCLPIGFENRHWKIGGNVMGYATAMERFVVHRPYANLSDDQRPWLLIAFYPKSRVPDRQKVLSILRVFPPKGVPKLENPWYNYTDLDHSQWLEAITYHKFVLAPFGHGLDTHRISEILLMGGIPVMRRSTISSCYDDSDNVLTHPTSGKTLTRGSLPVVILDKWEDLTLERLQREWERIKRFPHDHWDWKRVFMNHWEERIKFFAA